MAANPANVCARRKSCASRTQRFTITGGERRHGSCICVLNMRPRRLPDLILLVIAVLGLLAFQYLRQTSQPVAAIPYSEFQTLLRDKQISEVEIVDRQLTGKFKKPKNGKPRFSRDAGRYGPGGQARRAASVTRSAKTAIGSRHCCRGSCRSS